MEVCDFVKLVFSGSGGCIRHFACKDGHDVDDEVFWGERSSCKVRVSELNGV